MYFSNIHNPELQHFHSTIGVDFTMSLTDMLESDLFEIENLGNNIYRVFPLFYCKNIISSNSNDKILDTRCLILNKREKETYLSFRTQQDNNNIIYDDNLLNPKKINDTLSTDEFNAMVYMLRSKTTLDGTINFEDSTEFKGVYATYELENSEDIARNDIGFIITPELKRNPLTIKLVNPFFLNAKYILSCTVKSLVGANILNEDNVDYKTVDTFTVELVENMEVGLDVAGYVEDSVLCFDIEVNVSFDVPEIVNSNFTLNLSSEHEKVFIGENVELTARLTGEDNVAGYNVQFFEDNVLIGSGTTNNEGVAVLEYLPGIIGSHVYSCKTLGLTDSINVSMNKYQSHIDLSSNKSIAYIPTTFTVSGVLIDERGAVSNASVLLYNNNSLLATLTTGNDGEFSHTVSVDSDASFSLHAKFEETASITGSNSSYVNVVARKLNTNLTINLNKSSMYYTETVTISGKLTDELGRNITGATIKLYQNNNEVATATTNNNGEYSFTKTYNTVGNYSLKVIYAGDNTHNNTTSNNKSLIVNKAPVTMTISPTKSVYNSNDDINVTLASNYGSFSAQTLNINRKSVSGSNNTFTSIIGPVSDNSAVIEYDGTSNYQGVSKTISVDNVVAQLYVTVEKETVPQRRFYINVHITDLNGNALVNANITGLGIKFEGTFNITAYPDDIYTNEYGDYYIQLNIPSSQGKITAIYGDVSSDAVNYSW